MARQTRVKFAGPPAARWPQFAEQGRQSLVKRGVFKRRRGAAVTPDRDAVELIAAEIVSLGIGPEFLTAVRRGRPTQRQGLRYQLLRAVEQRIGDDVPRRRPDNNTPDALALRNPRDVTLTDEPAPAKKRRDGAPKKSRRAKADEATLPFPFFAACTSEDPRGGPYNPPNGPGPGPA